jgi:hypothetical protein
MSPKLDSAGIAERIRSLLGDQDGGDAAATALLLGIDSNSLSRSIDRHLPHPSLSVMTAIVRHYGVDPSWLAYGEYDPTTHGIASEMGKAISNDDVLKLLDSPKRSAEQEIPSYRPESQLGI